MEFHTRLNELVGLVALSLEQSDRIQSIIFRQAMNRFHQQQNFSLSLLIKSDIEKLSGENQ